MLNVARQIYRFILQRKLYFNFPDVCDGANYIRLGERFWIPRAARRKAPELAEKFKYAVYFDNSDKESVYQITKWFSSGFFSADEVLVVFCQYTKSRNFTFRVLEQYGISFIAITRFDEINFNDFKAIFYPFNTITNPYLIYCREAKHIFIAHGESDKLASVNPMIRMYDHVLVSGEIAKSRLIEHQVFLEGEIEGRVKAIGALSRRVSSPVERVGCLYAPTWEGADEKQRYSSLDKSVVCRHFKSISSKFSTLSIRPHPSTGVRDPDYLGYLFDTIHQSSKYFDSVIVLVPSISRLKNFLKKSVLPSNVYVKIDDDLCVFNYELVFTDVSSVIAECTTHKVPNICFLKAGGHEELPSLSASFAQNVIEDINLLDIESYLASFESLVEVLNKKMYSCDPPFSELESVREKFDTLKNHFLL